MSLTSHERVAEEWLETPGAWDAMRRLVKLKEHSSSSYVAGGESFIKDFLRAWLITNYVDVASAAFIQQIFVRAHEVVQARENR